jgi:mercuric ion binding protein
MKKLQSCFAAAMFLALTNTLALAAPKTVTLDVPGMTCQLCPITVKKALQKVEGVSKVNVNFEKKEAVVTFDDAKTKVDTLKKATADAGYPSNAKEDATK